MIVVIAMIWLGKTFYFIGEIDLKLQLKPHTLLVFVSSMGLALLTVGMFSRNWRSSLFAFSIYSAMTVLLYADVVYQRYYNAILRIELFAVAGQLRTVHDSVLSLLKYTDLFYFIDLPFIALGMWLFYKKGPNWELTKLPRRVIATSGLAILLLISFVAFKPTYSDQYKVSLTGVIPAHLYDVKTTLYKKIYLKQNLLKGESLEKVRNGFAENQKLQKSSPYFGQFEGKNVIIVQAESLNTFPIGVKIDDQSVTPNMDELIGTSHYYPNTFLQIGRGNTSDAEFVANNSLYPMGYLGAYKGYPTNNYLSLANVLKGEGYSTSATHGNKPDFWNRDQAYPSQGYEEFYHSNHPKLKADEEIGMGISDESLFKQMVNIYKGEQKPFYNFFITLTNHRPFVMPDEHQYLDLPKQFEGTATGNYLQSVRYFDEALGIFIDELKAAGLWDESIFVLYGDHYGPLPSDGPEIKELLNVTFDKKESFKIPLIIHHPGQTTGVLNEGVGSQMDIFPTISALLGIEDPLVQIGTSLDTDIDQTVGFAFEINRYSFISDQYDYIASHDGVFENGICTDNETNQEVEVETCRKGYQKVVKDIQISETLLDLNLVDNIFKH
jgi:lipoteichoic acid synthase